MVRLIYSVISPPTIVTNQERRQIISSSRRHHSSGRAPDIIFHLVDLVRNYLLLVFDEICHVFCRLETVFDRFADRRRVAISRFDCRTFIGSVKKNLFFKIILKFCWFWKLFFFFQCRFNFLSDHRSFTRWTRFLLVFINFWSIFVHFRH